MQLLNALGCMDDDTVAAPALPPVMPHRVADSSLLIEGGRLHFNLEGRYVTVLRLKGTLQCIDSVCFHAGGPLGVGDIEDLQGKTCIVCPWHYYKIDVATGDKYYQSMSFVDGKMIAGAWTSNGIKQRVHKVYEEENAIFVELSAAGKIDSDNYASNTQCGERVLAGSARQAVGGDGKKPSGHVMQQAREVAELASNTSSSPNIVSRYAANTGT